MRKKVNTMFEKLKNIIIENYKEQKLVERLETLPNGSVRDDIIIAMQNNNN